jgi:hypothetical protein
MTTIKCQISTLPSGNHAKAALQPLRQLATINEPNHTLDLKKHLM